MSDKKEETPKILAPQKNWNAMYFCQKSDVIYQLSFAFCDRFIDRYKDRTRDQVIQAARSCKQNIVEGLADGVTSTEMQLKLLNVARASLKELREDYEDYIKSRHLKLFAAGDERYERMIAYCRSHNKLADYEPFFQRWSDEEMCNCALTLCHMTDRMMLTFMQRLEKEFVTEGGIKERMYKARTGYRQHMDQQFKQTQEELRQTISTLRAAEAEAQRWKAAYDDLRQRALKAYREQQHEIERLKEMLGERNKQKPQETI